jgi:peroxiredoxin
MGVSDGNIYRGWLGTVALWACLCAPAVCAAKLEPGQPAPDFALKSLGGANLRLSEYRGEVVLLSLWASWCGDCRDQLPLLDDLQRRYRDAGVQVLGVNLDDMPERARDLASGLALEFPVLLDSDKAVARLYDPDSLPLTLLIDRSGTVREVRAGFRGADANEYVAGVDRLLAE